MIGQNKDAMRPQPLQTSSGVSIIPVAVEHAVALASLVQTNIEHLAAFLPAVANLFSIQAANDHLCSALERASEGEIFEWHLFVEGALCGSIRLKDIDRDDHKAKIGYFIDHRFAGKGIVTAAVRTVLGFCFGAAQSEQDRTALCHRERAQQAGCREIRIYA